MNFPLRLDFPSLLKRIRDQSCLGPVTETLWQRGGFVVLACGRELQSVLDSEESCRKVSVREAVAGLEARIGGNAVAICHTHTDTTVKPIRELAALLSHKSLPPTVSMVQFLPMSEFSQPVHRLSIDQSYLFSHYSLLDISSGQSKPGENERIYRKLQAETKRLVGEIEGRVGLRLISAVVSYVVSEGNIKLLAVDKAMLSQGKGAEIRCRLRFSRKMRTNRDLVRDSDSELMSPRARTPALTCPSSPRSCSRTEGSPTPRLPAVSPRGSPFFNPNFKEMLALTMEKQNSVPGNLTSRRPPLSQIAELIKDDERFFEYVGLERREEPKNASGGSEEATFSTTSTSYSRTRDPKPKLQIPRKPPLPRLFHPVLRRNT